jgi:hypothetical protein
MPVEPPHESARLMADNTVGVDEFIVVIAQKRAHLRKPLLEVKEHRAATDERLDVTANFRREKFIELGQKLRFAADPFQKRLCFFRGNGFNGSDRELFTGARTAWGFGDMRANDFRKRPSWVRNFSANSVSGWFWIGSLI